MGSIRSRTGVGVREREALGEVDDVFQGLFDRMELPLFLRGFVVDWKRKRLPVIPKPSYVGLCP